MAASLRGSHSAGPSTSQRTHLLPAADEPDASKQAPTGKWRRRSKHRCASEGGAIIAPTPFKPDDTSNPVHDSTYGTLSVLTKSETIQSGGKMLVDIQDVQNRKGAIAVAERYSPWGAIDVDIEMKKRVVGRGSSGEVVLGRHRMNRDLCAIKSFSKAQLNERKLLDLKLEVEVHLSLDHPNIVRLEHVYETPNQLHMIMEYLHGGTICERIQTCMTFSELQSARVLAQVLSAVAYLHARGVVHRDIKPGNIVFEHNFRDEVKVIDFGLAALMTDEPLTKACGTRRFAAPEVFNHMYSEKADLWSVGIVAYIMLVGAFPLPKDWKEACENLKAGLPWQAPKFAELSHGAENFVRSFFAIDPNFRPSAVQALQHPWLKEMLPVSNGLDATTKKKLQTLDGPSASHADTIKGGAMPVRLQSQLKQQYMDLAGETGTVTLKDFKTAVKGGEHGGMGSFEADRIFNLLDTNNDGEVGYTEYVDALRPKQRAPRRRRVRNTCRLTGLVQRIVGRRAARPSDN